MQVKHVKKLGHLRHVKNWRHLGHGKRVKKEGT